MDCTDWLPAAAASSVYLRYGSSLLLFFANALRLPPLRLAAALDGKGPSDAQSGGSMLLRSDCAVPVVPATNAELAVAWCWQLLPHAAGSPFIAELWLQPCLRAG